MGSVHIDATEPITQVPAPSGPRAPVTYAAIREPKKGGVGGQQETACEALQNQGEVFKGGRDAENNGGETPKGSEGGLNNRRSEGGRGNEKKNACTRATEHAKK